MLQFRSVAKLSVSKLSPVKIFHNPSRTSRSPVFQRITSIARMSLRVDEPGHLGAQPAWPGSATEGEGGAVQKGKGARERTDPSLHCSIRLRRGGCR